MLMAPCYAKLLDDPHKYLSFPLKFINESKYDEMKKIGSGTSFPLATLGDSEIEIHFLHYENENQALTAWKRRVERIDWGNIFVKFDCGKDYSTEEIANYILSLPYKNLIVFGPGEYFSGKIISVKKYSINALIQFYNCFADFNPFIWLLKKDVSKENLFERKVRQFIFNK